MKNEMNEIPTPETNAFMLEYNRAIAAQKTRPSMWDKLQSLERRLTIARDGFKELINAIETGSFSNGEYSRCEIKQAKEALTKTAPKP